MYPDRSASSGDRNRKSACLNFLLTEFSPTLSNFPLVQQLKLAASSRDPAGAAGDGIITLVQCNSKKAGSTKENESSLLFLQ